VTVGRGACRASAVRVLVDEAPNCVEWLLETGMRFDVNADGAVAMGLEGGHSRRRVLHAGGARTGRAAVTVLRRAALAHARITMLRGYVVDALLRDDDGGCAGASARGPQRQRLVVRAGATILATGGAAGLWARTTNPRAATGTGLSLAAALGANLADLEFMQFHPTALVNGANDGFLISEAVRGEGAKLLNAHGDRFVDELAGRDVVCAALLDAMRETGSRSVHLDMRMIPAERFPNIAATLRRVKLDPERDLIPVAPAAHYMVGGIATDLDGRASVRRLYAVGECSCTGIHGANRLASNSLTECLVFGRRAGGAAAWEDRRRERSAGYAPEDAQPAPAAPAAVRDALWQYGGPLRIADDLARLRGHRHPLTSRIGEAATERRESRGSHRRADHPSTDPIMDGRHLVLNGASLDNEVWQ
jgi:L-aspartate oxidase